MIMACRNTGCLRTVKFFPEVSEKIARKEAFFEWNAISRSIQIFHGKTEARSLCTTFRRPGTGNTRMEYDSYRFSVICVLGWKGCDGFSWYNMSERTRDGGEIFIEKL